MVKRVLALIFFSAAVGLAACAPAASTAPSLGTTETLPAATMTDSGGGTLPSSTP
jgi:hypothetical protein